MNLLQPMPSIVILLAIGALTSGSPFTEDKDYDYDAANSDISNEGIADENAIVKGAEKEVMATPKFISSPQSVLVNEGDTIRLPCMVDRLEGFVMLWKKNMDIITVASQIIDKRVRLSEDKNGNHLIIGQATPEDSGEYTCQISAYKPTEITHKVLIRVKPEISTTPEEVLIVNEGSPASLECNVVSGTPTPEVKWVRKDTGEEEIVGTTLTFSQVTRQHAGYYLCMADNGFGPSPVQKEVRLQVHYAPEIEVEEAFIVTDMGEEQEISCVVDSSPAAEVTWMKDGAGLDGSSPDTVLSQDQNRHSLLIVAVSKQSVGQYSCTANNSLGEATATADISGDAHPAVILSNHVSDHQHQFTLEWSAESESEIEEFEVALRKEGDNDWKLYEVTVKVEGNETNTNDTTERDSEYHEEFNLTDLEPGTTYEVTVASRNKFGLNTHGDLFTFTTKAADPEPVEDKTSEEQTSEEQTDKKAPEQQPSVSTSSSRVMTPVWSLSLILFSGLRLLV
eukprot:TRINITY_DN7496_c0_g1_i1.p1 TRINITY_DN7496_c0_g1~~TRINITY_DN7496_c0_g1_i1.p1  ORF type:complete len:508 (+),score=142.78 TRINITY_DN7496_c0_g1_i1:62-1585(+)